MKKLLLIFISCTFFFSQNINAQTFYWTTNVLCKGDATACINVDSTFPFQWGTAPYSFQLFGSTVQNFTNGQICNLPAGSYTIQVTDALNSSINQVVNITEPPALQITNISTTTPSCIPGNDASITITANGGTQPLFYSNGPTNQISNVFTNQGSGVYTITVTDNNLCTTTSTATVQSPSAPAWTSVTSNNVSCNGINDGAIVAIAQGGTSPLSYFLTPTAPQAPSGTFYNLSAGAYTVGAVDANNCSIQTTVVINEPSMLVVDSVSITQPSCTPGNDGIASIHMSGGVAPYSIAINQAPQGPVVSGNSIINLKDGNYMVIVSDANGCSASTSFFVQPVSNLTINSFNYAQPICKGDSNGWISIVASGSGPVSYSLFPNLGTEVSPGNYQNLPTGTYTISMNDSDNCPLITEIFLGEGGVSIQNVSSSFSNCVDSSGIIHVTALSQNVGTIFYSITPQLGTVVGPGHFQNLPNGNYIITAIDAASCTISTTVSLSYPANPHLTNIATTDVDCYGDMDGIISCSATGGTPPYSFGLDPIIQNGSGVFNNLASGTYSISVIDSNGCTDDQSVVIHQPPRLVLSHAVYNAKCAGSNSGRIELNATGGTGSHSFGVESMSNSTGTFPNLLSGGYNCYVVDANFCTDTLSTFVGENVVQLSTIFKRNESCIPGNDGEIRVAGIPSDTNYLYSLDSLSWSRVNHFQNLVKGNYTIYLKNPNDICTAKTMDTIEFINNIPLNTVVVHQEQCFGADNGSIEIPDTNYSYSLQPIAGSQTLSGMIENIPPGIYTLIAEKANGCRGEKVISITAADSMWIENITSSPTNVYCYGTITATADGGSQPLTFALSPNDGKQNRPGHFTNLCHGSYQITITDLNNCKLQSELILVQDEFAAENVFDKFIISPNPANESLNLLAPFELDLEYQFMNVLGQLVASGKAYGKSFTIPTASLHEGIYILYMKSIIDQSSRKILIQH